MYLGCFLQIYVWSDSRLFCVKLPLLKSWLRNQIVVLQVWCPCSQRHPIPSVVLSGITDKGPHPARTPNNSNSPFICQHNSTSLAHETNQYILSPIDNQQVTLFHCVRISYWQGRHPSCRNNEIHGLGQPNCVDQCQIGACRVCLQLHLAGLILWDLWSSVILSTDSSCKNNEV